MARTLNNYIEKKPQGKDKVIHIRVTNPIQEELKKAAKKRGIKVSEFIRAALRKALDESDS
jgi:uncharacterized protein (DUF1778 family)